jgi:hypothetical protein
MAQHARTRTTTAGFACMEVRRRAHAAPARSPPGEWMPAARVNRRITRPAIGHGTGPTSRPAAIGHGTGSTSAPGRRSEEGVWPGDLRPGLPPVVVRAQVSGRPRRHKSRRDGPGTRETRRPAQVVHAWVSGAPAQRRFGRATGGHIRAGARLAGQRRARAPRRPGRWAGKREPLVSRGFAHDPTGRRGWNSLRGFAESGRKVVHTADKKLLGDPGVAGTVSDRWGRVRPWSGRAAVRLGPSVPACRRSELCP